MPRMQTAVSAFNATFGPERVMELDPSPLSPGSGASLSEALLEMGVPLDRATAQYVEGWPSGIQAAVRAVLHDNLRRDAVVPITFAWAPGYDFEVTIWDVLDTAETAGGITLLFKSRYPDDPHPLAAGPAAAAS